MTVIKNNKQAQKALVGATILGVDLRPFADGRGGKAYRPVLHLSNGTRVVFDVQETEDDYGVLLQVLDS